MRIQVGDSRLELLVVVVIPVGYSLWNQLNFCGDDKQVFQVIVDSHGEPLRPCVGADQPMHLLHHIAMRVQDFMNEGVDGAHLSGQRNLNMQSALKNEAVTDCQPRVWHAIQIRVGAWPNPNFFGNCRFDFCDEQLGLVGKLI